MIYVAWPLKKHVEQDIVGIDDVQPSRTVSKQRPHVAETLAGIASCHLVYNSPLPTGCALTRFRCAASIYRHRPTRLG